MKCVAFGPLEYAIEVDALPPEWQAFERAASAGARRVRVRFSDGPSHDQLSEPDECRHGFRFSLRRLERCDELDVDVSEAGAAPAPARWVGFVAALSTLVALDAPRSGAFVIHAGGVSLARGGVALILAPPGTGKSTRLRAVGPRAFTFNAALVAPGEPHVAWPLPFAGVPDDPSISRVGPEPIAMVALLERAERAHVERAQGVGATIALHRALIRPPWTDPCATLRIDLAMTFASSVPVIRLGSPGESCYLAALDGRQEILGEERHPRR